MAAAAYLVVASPRSLAAKRGSLGDGAEGRLSSGQHRLRRLEVGGGGVIGGGCGTWQRRWAMAPRGDLIVLHKQWQPSLVLSSDA